MPLTLMEVSVDRIHSDETLRSPDDALAECIRRIGMLRPIDLRASAEGQYELVDGGRRLAVARQLGRSTITALVEDAGAAVPVEMARLALNLRRRSLEKLHVARLARRLVQGGCTQAELAARLAMNAGGLSRMLKVAACPELEHAILVEGMEFSVASLLAALLPGERREMLARLRETAGREGRFPTVRAVKEMLRLREGARPMPDFSDVALATLADALAWHAFPMEVQVVRAQTSRTCVTIALTESDAEALEASLSEILGGRSPLRKGAA